MSKKTKIQDVLNNGQVIIYGAHLVAIELYRYLQGIKKDFAFTGFVVTSMADNPGRLEGQKVMELQDCRADKDTPILIAMPEKYHEEAEAYARGLGYSFFLKIGLDEMSRLKGKQLVSNYKKYNNLCFDLYEDVYDASWLNMAARSEADKQSMQRCDPAKRHYKFPILCYLDAESIFQESGKLDFYGDYEGLFGNYYNLHGFPSHTDVKVEQEEAGKQLHIYMVCSPWDSASVNGVEYPGWIRPIQAGSVFSQKKTGTYLDETGDNISGKNRALAEMTAAYWIWKNAEPVKYKGLCHYRRHFLLNKEDVMSLDQNGIDVILTTPRYVPGGVRQMFLAETPVKEPVWQVMMQAVSECHPADRKPLETCMEACLYCPNNMVIAKSGIYDAYCEWIFPVLFRMMEIEEKNEYKHEKDRHIAYAAELLTSYYFVRHKDMYRMAVTDYKFYS